MIYVLVSLLSWLMQCVISYLPPDADMGEQVVNLILLLVGKAVTMTTTDVDDELFAQVATALRKDVATCHEACAGCQEAN